MNDTGQQAAPVVSHASYKRAMHQGYGYRRCDNAELRSMTGLFSHQNIGLCGMARTAAIIKEPGAGPAAAFPVRSGHEFWAVSLAKPRRSSTMRPTAQADRNYDLARQLPCSKQCGAPIRKKNGMK